MEFEEFYQVCLIGSFRSFLSHCSCLAARRASEQFQGPVLPTNRNQSLWGQSLGMWFTSSSSDV